MRDSNLTTAKSKFFLPFLVILPWLNPFTVAPTASVIPQLFCWVCSAVFVLAWQRNTSQEQARTDLSSMAATAWLTAALVSSAMALIQYFGATAPFGGWVNQPEIGVAYANLRQRNQFASLTSMGLAALVLWIAAAQTRSAKWTLPLAMPIAVLLGLGNAASSSRTGMVQLFLLCALLWCWRGGARSRNRVYLMVAAIVGYCGGLILLAGPDTGMLARLRDGDSICSSRITLWSNVLHLVAQKPWSGWGWGELDYAHFITLYPGERFCDILDNAHNLPLHLAVELGVPAALLFCGLCGWTVWRAKPWREVDPGKQMAWAVLTLIALHSLLEYPLWYGPFQIAVAISIWLIYRPKGSASLLVLRTIAVVTMVLCAYVAWDYWRVRQIYLPPEERAEAYRENTLEKIRPSFIFKGQVQFAELSVTPLTPENAQQQFALARTVLHFSPEMWVAQRVIDSAELLSLPEQAKWYRARSTAAFASPPHSRGRL